MIASIPLLFVQPFWPGYIQDSFERDQFLQRLNPPNI